MSYWALGKRVEAWVEFYTKTMRSRKSTTGEARLTQSYKMFVFRPYIGLSPTQYLRIQSTLVIEIQKQTVISYQPDEFRSLPDPDEVAEQLADQLEQNTQFSEVSERVRTSETPLAVPLGDQVSSIGSLRSVVRYFVMNGVQDTDEVIHVSFSKVDDEKRAGITTHPSLLETPNRLLPQAALAKAYQYGYWPKEWTTVQGGSLPRSIDSVAGNPSEQRRLGLVWKDEYYQKDFETDENWFADEDAVTEFVARMTDDDVSWAQYIPWYRTTAVSTYLLAQLAQTTDWTSFPDHPDARPNIQDRFDTATNPAVGDFHSKGSPPKA